VFRDVLSRFPLFSLLSPSQTDDLMAASQTLDVPTGEILFQEGMVGTWLFLIVSGGVRILRKKMDGREVTLGIARIGELVGDYVLLKPHKNAATCRTTEPSTLLQIPVAPLIAQLTMDASIGPHLKRFLRLHAAIRYKSGRPFLGFMSAPSALTYSDLMQEEHFQSLRTIQARGIAEDRWFWILDGSVTVHTSDGIVRELEPGDSFGARALIGSTNLPSVVSLSQTHCLSLAKSVFLDPTFSADHSAQSLRLDRPVLHDYPWVGQVAEADCGLASLAMILRFHHQPFSLESLRAQLTIAQVGLSLLELRQIARESGLQADAVRVDVNHMVDVHLPAIAHLTDGHYVVLYQMGAELVIVGDPANGIHRISRDELCRIWSGYLLLVRPAGY
jgi:ATP-binding cassette, subfamily B, bacterial HlyB/CyaB